MTEEERFWSKVNKTDSCWLWTAGCFGRNNEYGCFYKTGARNGIPAHRWAYENLIGPIPDGLVVDHLCRVTKCVNPNHLEPKTNKENILAGESITAKEAKQTKCKHGHSLHDAYILSGNRRDCRTCRHIRNSSRTHEYRKVHG